MDTLATRIKYMSDDELLKFYDDRQMYSDEVVNLATSEMKERKLLSSKLPNTLQPKSKLPIILLCIFMGMVLIIISGITISKYTQTNQRVIKIINDIEDNTEIQSSDALLRVFYDGDIGKNIRSAEQISGNIYISSENQKELRRLIKEYHYYSNLKLADNGIEDGSYKWIMDYVKKAKEEGYSDDSSWEEFLITKAKEGMVKVKSLDYIKNYRHKLVRDYPSYSKAGYGIVSNMEDNENGRITYNLCGVGAMGISDSVELSKENSLDLYNKIKEYINSGYSNEKTVYIAYAIHDSIITFYTSLPVCTVDDITVFTDPTTLDGAPVYGDDNTAYSDSDDDSSAVENLISD